MSVHFLYFLFKWKGVKPTSMSNKICRKWNKKERERSKNISNFKNINSKTPEKLPLVTLVTKSNFWISQSLFSILQSQTQPLSLSIWMFVGAISIRSFFSFWKLNYFCDMSCLNNPLSDIISCSSSTQLITSDFFLWY